MDEPPQKPRLFGTALTSAKKDEYAWISMRGAAASAPRTVEELLERIEDVVILYRLAHGYRQAHPGDAQAERWLHVAEQLVCNAGRSAVQSRPEWLSRRHEGDVDDEIRARLSAALDGSPP